MNFIEACGPYIFTEEVIYVGEVPVDIRGTISLKLPRESNDNPWLFSATFMFLARLLKCPVEDLAQPYCKLLGFTVKRTIKPGLYSALPSWNGSDPTISHDDLLGIAAINTALCEDLHAYGWKHGWVFNNRGLVSDIPSQWIGRFPMLITFIRSRAGVFQWNPLIVLWTVLEFLFADRKSEHGQTSGKCRRLIMARYFHDESSGLLKWSARKYLEYLNKEYGDVSALYRIYFPHLVPFFEYTRGVKFV